MLYGNVVQDSAAEQLDDWGMSKYGKPFSKNVDNLIQMRDAMIITDVVAGI